MKYALYVLGLALFALIGIATDQLDAAGIATAIGTLAVGSFAVRDAAFRVTRALPNGAATVTSASEDLEQTANGRNLANHEFLLTVPAVATGLLGDGATIRYDVVTSTASDLSSPTIVQTGVLTQTGAGGAGAAAATVRFRLPTNCQRYVGFLAVKSSAGDASALTATLELLF